MSLNNEALTPVFCFVSATNKLRSMRFLLASEGFCSGLRGVFFSTTTTVEGIADPYRHRDRCGMLPPCSTRDGSSSSGGSAGGVDAGRECARRWPTFKSPATSPPGCGIRYRYRRSSSLRPGRRSRCCRPGCNRLRSHRSWHFRRPLSLARP